MSTDIEARQLALRNFEAAQRAETESARLFDVAKRATERHPGTRAAVQAQQAYTNRLNAEVGRFRSSYALLAADLGKKAVDATKLATLTKDAEKQRTLQLEAKHATRWRNMMLDAANSVTNALKNLPGLPVSQRPPSAQQTTVGLTNAFRSPEFLSRFTHFFPSDIKAAAGAVGYGNGGLQGLDAVAECEACLNRDLATVRERCAKLPFEKPGTSDPMFNALVTRGAQMAQMAGFGADMTVASNSQGVVGAGSALKYLAGAAALGLGIYLFTRS